MPVDLVRNPTGGIWGKIANTPSPYFAHVPMREVPDEVALVARCPVDGKVVEVARQSVEWPRIEADATARAEHPVNPVDLGAILVPHDWLLVRGGERVRIDIAAISRSESFPSARLKAWFEGGKPVETGLALGTGQRVATTLALPSSSAVERDVLHLALSDGGRELWRKEIRTMVVAQPPRFPKFGAVETKLRYDAPISVAGMVVDHDKAWDPKLNDIVVFLPNGSRFVFWRWFRYAPVWAGPNNTAFNYEWAENLSRSFEHPGWGTLYPEPLFDYELRYGRVRIIESTSSRVHVRWTYEGTDPQYRRWGDQVTEDFYFYPDGFGTRVMSLTSEPNVEYEVSEFIVLTPQGAHPVEILPARMIRMLYVDGQERDITYPVIDPGWKPYGNTALRVPGLRDLPALYRIFQEKNDPATPIFFNPRHVPKSTFVYQHRYEEGEPASLALGGRGMDSPGVSCFWTAIKDLPEPISTSTFPMIDALGKSRALMTRRWSWLIAKTDAPDKELLDWAQSYSAPPSLELTGARLDLPPYVPERRALRLVSDAPTIGIKVKPATSCVNPVFELAGAPGKLGRVMLNGRELPPGNYAWDGRTLWVKAKIDKGGADLTLHFR